MVKRLIFCLVALVALGTAWMIFRPANRPRQIKRRFELLCQLVGRNTGEKNTVMALKMQRLGGLFAPSCTLATGHHQLQGTYTPEEIVSLAARFRPLFDSVNLSFGDFDITLFEDNRATVLTTVRLDLRSRDGSRTSEVHELRVVLEELEGAWRFSEFTESPVLER